MPKLKTTPSSKLLYAMSRHPALNRRFVSSVAFGFFTVADGTSEDPTYEAYVTVCITTDISTPFSCLISAPLDYSSSDYSGGPVLPEDLLFYLGINHLDTGDACTKSTLDGTLQGLVLTYTYDDAKHFFQCADHQVRTSGGAYLIPTVTHFLNKYGDKYHKPKYEYEPLHPIWYHFHRLNFMESAGVSMYEDLVDLRQYISRDNQRQNLCTTFSVYGDHGLRTGIGVSDGTIFCYLPDDDPIFTPNVRVDRHILTHIKGRGYTNIDLMGHENKLCIKGELSTKEEFVVMWSANNYNEPSPLSTKVESVYSTPERTLYLPPFTLDEVKEIVGEYKLEDISLVCLTYQFPEFNNSETLLLIATGEAEPPTYLKVVYDESSEGRCKPGPDLRQWALSEEGVKSDPKLGILYKISFIKGSTLKPFLNSKVAKRDQFYLRPGCYNYNKSVWYLTTSTCSFDPDAASCVILPNGLRNIHHILSKESICDLVGWPDED